MRLRTRFNIMIITGMAIPILLPGILAYNISKNIISNRISTNLITSAENSIDTIDRLLFERSISVEQWAGNSTFRTALDYNSGMNQARDVMQDLQANSGGTVREIALVDTKGKCFVSTDEEHTAAQKDWSITKWWQHSINGETYYNDWQIMDREKNLAGVVFSTPIIKRIQTADSIQNYKYLGVLTLFIDWSKIENELKKLKEVFQEVDVSSFAFLLQDKTKAIIAHSDHQSYGASIEGSFPADKIQVMQNSYAGLFSLDYQGEPYTVCFIRNKNLHSTPGFDWTLVMGVRNADIFSSLNFLFFCFSMIGIAAMVVVLFVNLSFARRVLSPLSFLAEKMNLVRGGDYEVKVEFKTRDEIEDLANTFNDMVVGLAEKERIKREMALLESELKVARRIQMGIVPRVFPAFPDRSEFDLHAYFEPAKEVGGDFYDFFLLDEDHLCVTIGDVSGKGIPAAFFMAVTKTLIKTKANRRMTPDEILFYVNNELCQDNDSCMFATIFLGILKISSGEFSYSNGGHNLPYIIRLNGKIERLAQSEGIALGVMENATFAQEKLTFQPGEGIVLYTDGVTEAMDAAENLFTEKTLQETISRDCEETPEKICKAIAQDVMKFSAGVQQSDDITILVLKRSLPGDSI